MSTKGNLMKISNSKVKEYWNKDQWAHIKGPLTMVKNMGEEFIHMLKMI